MIPISLVHMAPAGAILLFALALIYRDGALVIAAAVAAVAGPSFALLWVRARRDQLCDGLASPLAEAGAPALPHHRQFSLPYLCYAVTTFGSGSPDVEGVE